MNIAIIFAGGKGARMGSGIPKQFIEVNAKPIIIHTLDMFDEHKSIDKIYIACKEDYIDKLWRMIDRFSIGKVAKIVPGGETSQDSTYNALVAAASENPGDSIVLIHDGVRPCVNSEHITRLIDCVKENGSAITCTPMYETPIESDDGVNVKKMPPRDNILTVQAPQCFYLKDILSAHESVRKESSGYSGIIDSCTMFKHLGKEVCLVEGNRGNIKITTPEDIYLFKAMLEYNEALSVFGFKQGEISGRLSK